MKQKTIITTAVLFLCILLFVLLIIIPLWQGIKKNSKDLEVQYLEVLKASLAETETAEFFKFFQIEKENFERIDNLFIDAQTPIDFIQFVEEIADDLNLEVQIRPGTAKKEVPWPAMDFQLSSIATYPDFLRFVEKLENGPFLLSMQNTSIARERSSLEKENEAQNVNFSLLVKTFTKPLLQASKKP